MARGWLGVLVMAVVAAAGSAWHVVDWWSSPLRVEETTAVRVEGGDTASDLAERLAQAGLLDRPRLLRWTMRFAGLANDLKVGEYPVLPGDTPQRLVRRIVRGDVITYRFRIVEGASLASTLAELRAEPKLRHTLGNVAPDALLALLGVDEAVAANHGEGWFFPDTYLFVAGDEDRDLLRRAHRKMRRELQAAWEARTDDLPYREPYEALIVASIIEKETARAADRSHVSQVIASRLRENMRLQVDPTVIYGLGDAFDGNLTRAHLRQPTSYNTYVRTGLPPTPISLPGRESLRAAVQPSGEPYLYFVARGDGSSEFSTTFEEHLAAVDKYQRNRR